MNFAIKPEWNAATATLTGLGLVIAWPLGLGMAAYATWGHKLKGKAATEVADSTKAFFAAKEPADTASQSWKDAEFARLDAERARVVADVTPSRKARRTNVLKAIDRPSNVTCQTALAHDRRA